jgi:hypothetical protein
MKAKILTVASVLFLFSATAFAGMPPQPTPAMPMPSPTPTSQLVADGVQKLQTLFHANVTRFVGNSIDPDVMVHDYIANKYGTADDFTLVNSCEETTSGAKVAGTVSPLVVYNEVINAARDVLGAGLSADEKSKLVDQAAAIMRELINLDVEFGFDAWTRGSDTTALPAVLVIYNSIDVCVPQQAGSEPCYNDDTDIVFGVDLNQ